MAMSFPASPSSGTLYLSPKGRVYVYDGSSWTTSAKHMATNIYDNSFLYRAIYVRGYIAGGYYSTSPWKNVNKTIHSTDVTTNLGDMLDYGGSYVVGGYSDFNLYIYAVSDTFQGSSAYTSSFSMTNDSKRSHSSSWDLLAARSVAGSCMLRPGLDMAYYSGGGAGLTTDKHNYTTETMSVGPARSSGSGDAGSTSIYGVSRGMFKSANSAEYLSWSTETWTAWAGTGISTDGQPKGHSTKWGFGYIRPGSNTASTSYYKMSDTTSTSIATGIVDPNGVGAGEENHETGQNHGYYLGQYNGVQNNNTTKFNYLTDILTTMGAATQPVGHTGMSSGANGTASNITGGM